MSSDDHEFHELGATGVCTRCGDFHDERRGTIVWHLYLNLGHDESDVWCLDDDYYRIGISGATSSPSAASCVKCLIAAARFGAAASQRLQALRPKQWDLCPYEAHSDDCNCRGEGGGR